MARLGEGSTFLKSGGDQAGVGPGSLGGEMQAVPEVFGMAGALGVPIDEHGFILVARDPVRQHLVVRRPRVAVGHRGVHHEDLIRVREDLHHLVELSVGYDAVVAYVDDHHLPEVAAGAELPEDAGGLGHLSAAAGVDGGQFRYVFLESVDGAEHHGVADGRHLASGVRGRPALTSGLAPVPPRPGALAALAGSGSVRPPRVIAGGIPIFGIPPWRPLAVPSLDVDTLGGDVRGFLRRLGTHRGNRERYAEDYGGSEGSDPAQSAPPLSGPVRLAAPLPGASQGTAPDGRLHKAVRE